MRVLRRGNLRYSIICLLLFSLPLVLLPETAWLISCQQEEEALLEQGKQYYMEGRYKEAIEKLTLAIELIVDKNKLIDAHIHIALCHFALGEMDITKEYLTELIRIDPAQELDPEYHPPAFVDLFSEVKEVILARIRVETEPSASRVFLDGEYVGLTPLQITDVIAGEHKLRIIKEGYKVIEDSLILKEGEERTVSYKLEKGPTIVKEPGKPPDEVKKGKGWMWILLGGAAAAAVVLLAARGGGETAKPEPTEPEPMLTIRIKVTFEMSNLEARWAIYVDDQKVFDEWLKVATHGGANPVYNKRTRQFTIQRRPGTFDLRLHGVEAYTVHDESWWIYPTIFELSIISPASEINRYRINPDSFSLTVCPAEAYDPAACPRQRSKRVTISKIAASTNMHSKQKHQVSLQALKGKIPNPKN